MSSRTCAAEYSRLAFSSPSVMITNMTCSARKFGAVFFWARAIFLIVLPIASSSAVALPTR